MWAWESLSIPSLQIQQATLSVYGLYPGGAGEEGGLLRKVGGVRIAPLDSTTSFPRKTLDYLAATCCLLNYASPSKGKAKSELRPLIPGPKRSWRKPALGSGRQIAKAGLQTFKTEYNTSEHPPKSQIHIAPPPSNSFGLPAKHSPPPFKSTGP